MAIIAFEVRFVRLHVALLQRRRLGKAAVRSQIILRKLLKFSHCEANPSETNLSIAASRLEGSRFRNRIFQKFFSRASGAKT